MISLFTLLLIGNNYLSQPSEVLGLQTPLSKIEFEITAPENRLTSQMDISAKAALVMERSSGMVLYEKNAHARLPMASLTKLMTALVTLEKNPLYEDVIVPNEATTIEGRKAYLASGEVVSIGDLLRALLIHSGNDAAITLASHENDSLSGFVSEMNRRAHLLGLKDTSYANPHGLDEEKNYSSAFDISLLANKLLDYDFVQETVQKREYTITDMTGRFSHPLQTTNELLFSDFPVYGVKTGTTDLAGECFVGLIRLEQKEYIISILGSEDRFQDTKALIWALQHREE